MTDSIDTSEREAEDPREPIRLPVREMRDEPVPHQAADPIRAALQLALEATPEELPAALSAVRAALAAQQAGVQVPQIVGYVTKIAEGRVLMLPRPSLDTTGMVPLCVFQAHAAAPEAPAQAEVSDAMAPDPLEVAIDNYVDGYVMEGDDSYHNPTEAERLMIKDAIMGLLVDDEWDRLWGEHIGSLASERAALASQPQAVDAGYAAWLADRVAPEIDLIVSDPDTALSDGAKRSLAWIRAAIDAALKRETGAA